MLLRISFQHEEQNYGHAEDEEEGVGLEVYPSAPFAARAQKFSVEPWVSLTLPPIIHSSKN